MTPTNQEEISAEERREQRALARKVMSVVLDVAAEKLLHVAREIVETEVKPARHEARRAALEEAAGVAYLQIMQSANKQRRTKTLGLRRETYCVEYAQETRDAVRALLDQPEKG